MCGELIVMFGFLQFKKCISDDSHASKIHTSDNARDAIGEMRGSVHPTSSMMSRLSTLNLVLLVIGIGDTKTSALSTCCITRLSPKLVVSVLHWSSPCCGFLRAPCASLSTPLTNPPTREHLTEDTRGSAHSKRRKISPSLYHKTILASSSRQHPTRNDRVQPQRDLLPPVQPRCRKSVSHISTTACALTNTLSTSRANRKPLFRINIRRRAQ